MSDLPTLRDRVAAMQALAAKATPGPWIVHPRTHTSGWGTCVGPAGEMIARMTGGRGSSPRQRAKDAAMLAAAPGLVTLAADLWAAYMAACDRADGHDRLEAMERADAAARKDIGVRLGMQSPDDTASCLADFEDAIVEARAELTAIRTALGNGADKAAWPPRLTVAEAVGRLCRESDAVAPWLRERAHACLMRANSPTSTTYERVAQSGAYEALTAAADAYEVGDLEIRADALAAGNDGEDDGA